MALNWAVERARKKQIEEDRRGLNDKGAQLGEGSNTSAHLSVRGYAVKSISYREQDAENPVKAAEDPVIEAEKAREVEWFPWIEVEKVDSGASLDYAMVRMELADFNHQDAVEKLGVSETISRDLDMFFGLRDFDITYDDFKPDNIGYFFNDGDIMAMPIDVVDGNRTPWREEENLSCRRFSDIIDVYITGNPDEDGLVDRYSLSVSEAEEYVMEYLGIEDQYAEGNPYRDLTTAFEEFDDPEELL